MKKFLTVFKYGTQFCFYVQWSGLLFSIFEQKKIAYSQAFLCDIGSFLPHDCALNMVWNRSKMLFSGQQWTEDSQVGRLADGNGDFEGNGIFSKLLLDVSSFCLDLCWYMVWSLECTLFMIHSHLLC